MRRSAFVVLIACLLASAPARAERHSGMRYSEGGGIPPGVGAILSLLGVMPHLADERMAYTLGISGPRMNSLSTTLFRGLEGVDGESMEVSTWSIRPWVAMHGREVGLHASVNLSLGRREQVGDGLTLRRSFGVRTLYHAGLNAAGLLGAEDFSFTLGPWLDVAIGPAMALRHEDGSRARWGRIGEIMLGPGVGTSWMHQWFTIAAAGGYLPGGPLHFVGASVGEADGRFAEADQDTGETLNDAQAALGRVRGAGAWHVGGMLTFNLYRPEEPYLILGVQGGWRRQDFRVRDGGFGLNERFREQEFHMLVSIGIGVPRGVPIDSSAKP